MLSFMLVEKSEARIHIIHSLADDRIPFCPYFIIPYVLWYFFLIGTIVYFALFCSSKKEYYQYIGTLAVGMTLFILVSYVYPNGQNLRPDLSGESGVFVSAVRYLYKIDTPTNIFPSIHVFNSIGAGIAISHSNDLKKHRWIQISAYILAALIILSTMFLKQHSVTDVIAAVTMACIIYPFVYVAADKKAPKLSQQPT